MKQYDEPQEAAKELVNISEQFGTEDNSTCMVCCIHLHIWMFVATLHLPYLVPIGGSLQKLGLSYARLYQTPTRIQVIDIYHEL